MKLIINIILVLFLFNSVLIGGENRLKSMGNLSYSVPDINAKINLFQVAENTAWMKVNDSSNWVTYSINSQNNWGDLKRRWDATENQFHYFSFAGYKHLGENQVFYGYVHYNWDVRKGIDFAIEKKPYAFDPFVLTDYYSGDIVYNGPEIFGAYSHRVNENIYWGISINYYINRGLKNFNSEAEIISREINASIDFIYKPNENYMFGLSVKPYQNMDITKFASLDDGQTPITRKYRGDFFYREKISTSDRNALSEGYYIRPQFSFLIGDLESVSYFNYYYQWLQIFDKPTKHIYDGYFQAQHYSFETINRFLLLENYSTYMLLKYKYEKYNDWAKEPSDNLLINQQKQENHKLVFGGSSIIGDLPLLAAFEFSYNLDKPVEDDFLANIFREGDMSNIVLKTGLEYRLNSEVNIRVGYIFNDYVEDEIWNYYKDYNGSKITFGCGWRSSHFQLDSYGEFGILKDKSINSRDRTNLNFGLSLKQYL